MRRTLSIDRTCRKSVSRPASRLVQRSAPLIQQARISDQILDEAVFGMHGKQPHLNRFAIVPRLVAEKNSLTVIDFVCREHLQTSDLALFLVGVRER